MGGGGAKGPGPDPFGSARAWGVGRVAGILIHTDLGHTENLNKKRQVSTLPEESVYSRPVFLHRGHSLTCWQDFERFCNFGDV